MAEKKRGLGKGLGALIPDVVTEERPVDVFFPAKPGSVDPFDADDDVSRETDHAKKVNDPAEGFRRARTGRTSKGRTPSARTTSSEASAADAPQTKKGDGTPAKKTARPRTAADVTLAAVSKAGARAAKPADDPNEDSTDDLMKVPGTAFGLLRLDDIRPNPRQPRTVFEEEKLDELVTSIQQVGVLQPVVVRVVDPAAPQYELIMGERRFRASKEAGLTEIPAIIREVPETDLLRDALLENLHRADLNPLEEAAAYQQLLDDFQCTQEELSQRIGRSRPQISNTLRLMKLPALVQRRVAAGVLSQGHARAILGLDDAAEMESLAQRVVAEGLSVRATEEAVVLANQGPKRPRTRASRAVSPVMETFASRMGDRLETKVDISMGKKKGKISVEFAGEDDLARIMELFGLDGE
ncbi:ParB/RepB/Spo0J family partition protein [Brevibacterium litoralis]|uniref:ParB/RepB/Spo0J family partition protein n=1 Tax=Brevibacterium litoralis TaxID=3138935 RepID=UPI003D9A3FB6